MKKTSPTQRPRLVRKKRRRPPKKKYPPEMGVIVPADMRDEEWNALRKTISDLRPDARFRICVAAGRYRDEVAASTTSLGSKRLILRMRRRISKLAKELEELTKDAVYLKAGVPWWSSRLRPNVVQLNTALRALRELEENLIDAQTRMNVGAGRKSSFSLSNLIKDPIWIQAEATKKPIKRSTKLLGDRPYSAFIHASVNFADPSISAGTIDSALKKNILERHTTLAEYGFDIATGKKTRIVPKPDFLPFRK